MSEAIPMAAGCEYATTRHQRHAARRRRKAAAFVCIALWAAPGMAMTETADRKATPRQACDAPGVAQVLRAVAQADFDTRAYWLDGTHLRWPGADAGGRYRLVHSATGQLRASSGDKVSGADAAFDLLPAGPLPVALSERFRFTGPGAERALRGADAARVPELLRGQLLLVREDAHGRVIDATGLQHPGALDARYAHDDAIDNLGVTASSRGTSWQLWAPTARAVSVCIYPTPRSAAGAWYPMRRGAGSGAWSLALHAEHPGGSYAYLVDVFVPGVGLVRNRVTDPYSISLSADSKRSWIGHLDDPSTKPQGWDTASRPAPLPSPTDMAIYELHVRDFARDDASVPVDKRGKYLAFAESGSDGMRHLRALRDAGMTDIHLLPVFDLASVPESGCATPAIADAPTDSEAQQKAVAAVAAHDCYNWGYDPHHFNAPEGSYASDPDDGAVRIREFRAMVQALHAAGLRVGMDVVYNHTSGSGQESTSVLDRIVPGYYHRLDAKGAVEQSTCCDNTATEHRMMGKLMRDSAALWARHYRIDSFRFDLMGHQPRAEMERLQRDVDAAAGRRVHLIGEGWNFGEIADGKRFVQASQGALNGSGIGTFSDRARDAIRGGGPADRGKALLTQKGYVNGLVDGATTCRPTTDAPPKPSPLRRQGSGVLAVAEAKTPGPCLRRDDEQTWNALLQAADLVRVGLAGSLRDYRITDAQGRDVTLAQIDYKGQPAGYASEPGEVVNYVENHDNQTLFDINAWKLPRDTSRHDRARVQVLALALNAFSQGIAYFHAGAELMRSKSLDRNSFDSGDWFNRIDWAGNTNHFGSGLPPGADNAQEWAQMRPLLRDARIRPEPEDIAFVRAAFNDLLRIRASSSLFRMRRAADIQARLSFPNSGPDQNPAVMAAHLDGNDAVGAGFREILYLVNVSSRAQTLTFAEAVHKAYMLHPTQSATIAADPRPRLEAQYHRATGSFTVPARTTVVYVVR